ncbi:hypothetical protein FQN54_002470 [Arachnomyces sp. PD_36]|nr:hypothetical protein FQN54_002470 [Arachnomyces sp. PD_36]
MRKYPQQRHPSQTIEYRENTTHGGKLKRGTPRSEQPPVSADSDSFASASDTLSDEDVLDVDVLEEIERGYYEHLRQQQRLQLLEAEENDDRSQSNMPYLISGSVSRDSTTNSELRQHSRKPESRSGRRPDGSARKQRKRRTRVTEESTPSDEYVYPLSEENAHDIEPTVEEIYGHSVQSTSNSDAMDPDPQPQPTKTHRRKGTKQSAYWIRPPSATKRRDVNRRREPISPRRDSNSSSHSSGPQATRSVSVDEAPIDHSPKPVLQRSKTTNSRARASTKTKGDVKDESDKPASTPPRDKKKSIGLFSNFFAGPLPPHLEKKVTCLTCFSDDIPISRSAKLACTHRMCHSCLKRVFTMSVKDPQHMPPRCCTADHIPLKHVEKLFDMKFKMKWNKKYQEYTTKNRIYCPSKGCGEWIKPNHIFTDTSSKASGGRKYGKCSRCKTKVCCTCNGKWHAGKDCPKDEETKRFVEIAQEEGWQRCYNCAAMVELKEGCNHMTCRCTAEFCMICGLQWKTCDCPMFNFDANEGEVEAMDIPRARRAFAEGGGRQPLRYQEELDRRRLQEQEDEAMARHMEALDIADYTDPSAPITDNGVFEVGNTGGHFMNEHFTRPQIQIDNMEHADRVALDTAMVHTTQPEDRSNTPPPPRSQRHHRRRNPRDIPPAPSPPLPESDQRTTSAFMRAFNDSPKTRDREHLSSRRRNTASYPDEIPESPPESVRTPRARKPRRHERRTTTLAGLDPVNGRQPTGVGRVDQWRRNCM